LLSPQEATFGIRILGAGFYHSKKEEGEEMSGEQKFRDVKAISGIFDITGGLEASEYIDRMRGRRESVVSIKFELIEFQGEPAVIFDDGDVILQRDSLGKFLMHVSLLMPNCELPTKLEIRNIGKEVGQGELP